MSSSGTKIFGIRVGIDPKFLVLGLLAIAGLIYWMNSGGDEHETGGQTAAGRPADATAAGTVSAANKNRGRTRRRGMRDDRGTLRLQTVAPANGEVDPLLRLDLLEKLSKVEMPTRMRNLFETGPAAEIGQEAPVPVRTVVPQPLPQTPTAVATVAPAPVQANIPLKYYGFARPSTKTEANRGFFLDGDDIVVAAEGQLIQQRYRVLQLTGTTARLEDTQIRLSQALPVVPQALEQGGGGYNRPGMMMQGPNPANQGFGSQTDVSEP